MSVDLTRSARLYSQPSRSQESRTTIVVAHRLTSIRKATSIAVVAGGRIVEQGTHEELLAAGGAFSKLSAVREG